MINIPTPDDIRRLRKKAGLTQAELAKRAGVSQSLIARIETGSVNPRLTTLKRILDALEGYISEELTASDVMTSPVIYVSPNDNIEKIVDIMWTRGISQVPVIDNSGNVIGTVYERNIVESFLKYRENAVKQKAKDVMSEALPMVSKSSKLSLITSIILTDQSAVLVMDKNRPIGIITRSDLMRKYLNLVKSSQSKPI